LAGLGRQQLGQPLEGVAPGGTRVAGQGPIRQVPVGGEAGGMVQAVPGLPAWNSQRSSSGARARARPKSHA
jgi:hypothetical protein